VAAATLVDLLRLRAEQAATPALTFLTDGVKEAQLSYQELDRQARTIAAQLQRLGAQGERVLLLYAPGLEYIAAFFGCLYAGAVAVPAYPPQPNSLKRMLPRLELIASDAKASVVLTTQTLALMGRVLLARNPHFQGVRWIASDTLSPRLAEGWREPELCADTLAFLQYTSGSTSAPKGVMLTHQNLLHNLERIHTCFGHSPASHGVIWLPPYHDMGLIGGILQPIYGGFPVALMSPVTFLRSPLRWLEAVSRYRATTSGGPNFAYELCIRKTTPEQRARLDLSSWRVAFNGAEPVRADTLERFAEAFAPAGFRPEAFYPCYGLAEATLIAAGGDVDEPPLVEHVRASALHHNRLEAPPAGQDDQRTLVGSGRSLPDQQIVIVNPETQTRSAPGEIGEIWVAGPSVAQGYWNRPEETRRTFQARLADTGAGPFLRTGDLGALRDGQLFVTGRMKDLIIIRGRNLYPQDIELTAERSHPSLRPGSNAAFSVEIDGEEQLVVVQELRPQPERNTAAVATTLLQAVAEQHEVRAHAVVLIKNGSIPKTSSGKIQRHACRAAFLAGTLDVVEQHTALPAEAGATPELLGREALLALPEHARRAALEEGIGALTAQTLQIAPAQIDWRRPISALGLESLMAIELQHSVEAQFGVSLPLDGLLGSDSLADLVTAVLRQLEQPEAQTLLAAQDDPAGDPASYGQRSLWFLQRLAPTGAAYNLASAVRIRAELDVAALRQAFQTLLERHPALRTTFAERAGLPVQRIQERQELAFAQEDAAGWSDADLRARLAAEANRPFDLEHGPLLRLLLLTETPGAAVLLLTVHHSVVDFWSLTVLASELGQIYQALRTGQQAGLAPVSLRYSDFARWQNQLVESPAGEQHWAYWREQLAGPLPVLHLPADRPRPPAQTYRGASLALAVEPQLGQRLRALARAEGATLFSALLAAFQALLHRYTGQDDIIVGAPAACRPQSEWAGVVGYFVNTLALRTRFPRGVGFRALLRQVAQTVRGGLAHQTYPFAALVERLQPERDPSYPPLFQVSFVLQKAHLGAAQGLSAFALGEEGARLDLGDLRLESLALPERPAAFDLTLMLAEDEAGLGGSLQYNSDLFDAATVARLGEHFLTLLEAVVDQPDRPIDQLPLLASPERAALLDLARGPALPLPAERSVPALFAAQAARTPDATALVQGRSRISYADLDRRANQLAHLLRRLGVGPEVRVALALPRSTDFVLALLATLKAGGAYLPLDPAFPPDRQEFMLRDAQAAVLLSNGSLPSDPPGLPVIRLDRDHALFADLPSDPPEVRSHPANLAYVIYTSGSTGRPKGAGVSHEGWLNLLRWFLDDYQQDASDRSLVITSTSFDFTQKSLVGPLLVGGQVHLLEHYDPAAIVDTVAREGITRLSSTPSAFYPVLEHDRPAGFASLAPLRTLFLGGEPIAGDRLAEWLGGAGAHTAVVNSYGPTECTDIVGAHLLTEAERRGLAPVPLGRPIRNTQLYILDQHLQPVPQGLTGELYVAGAGVGRGYLGRPDLTAERFLPNLFADVRLLVSATPAGPSSESSGSTENRKSEIGNRLYRTGDLARWRGDGRVEYLGRADAQVKVRGFRVETGEVEAVLRAHPDVREAVVVAQRYGAGDTRLLAYVVFRHAEAADAAGLAERVAELRRAAGERLPEYMLPSAIVPLEALPLTGSGKADRRALAERPLQHEPRSEQRVAPRTPLEQSLAQIWGEVLQVAEPGVHDSFFALGGHSLLATQVVARVRDRLGRDVPLRSMFEAPTIAGLADLLERLQPAAETPAPEPLVAARHDGPQPLSFAQQRMWLIEQIEPGGGAYVMVAAARIQGALDPAALEHSINAIVQRHEALRTTFALEDGQPVQVITPGRPIVLGRVELLRLPEPERNAQIRQSARQIAHEPFRLDEGPLLRAQLLRLAPEQYALLLAMHHIVTDGWSLGVFVRELQAHYTARLRGAEAALPPLAVQYTDFARWQRRLLQGARLEQQLAYWKDRLGGVQPLALPTDRPRPAVQTTRGSLVLFQIAPELTEALTRLGQRHEASLFMVLLAAFKTLLLRYTGQHDLVVGSPIANRTRPEIEPLIGCFINTLALRTRIPRRASFAELIGLVRETTLGAYAHQDVPFEQVLEAVQPARDLSHSPLFQVMLVLQNAPMPTLELAGALLSPLPVDNGVSPYDLTVNLTPEAGGLSGVLEYNTDLFDQATAERLAGHFVTLLEGALAAPDAPLARLELLGAEERRQLLAWGAPAPDLPAETLPARLAAQAARTPDATALLDSDRPISYAALHAQACRLAWHLRQLGVGPDALVGLALPRSADQIVALLGVLYAGGAYLPLDPSYPPERLALMIADARPAALIVAGADGLAAQFRGPLVDLAADAPALARYPATVPASGVGPDHLAYVIYTSGSTGAPKGVAVPQRAVVAHNTATIEAFALRPEDRVLQFATLNFDAAVEEIFPTLSVGATLVLRPGELPPSIEELHALIERAGLTVLDLPTAYWHTWTQELALSGRPVPAPVRLVVVGGEAADQQRLAQWQQAAGPHVAWLNTYGPTETAVVATSFRVAGGQPAPAPVPIGRPLPGVQALLLDAEAQLVPTGVPGELHLGGVQLARGYLGRPDLTAERFIPNPFGDEGRRAKGEAGDGAEQPSAQEGSTAATLQRFGARLYRTGDRARWRADGQLEFLGRADAQVKLRGFRIELGEIESALRAAPAVRDAAVLLREDSPGAHRLVAYVVPAAGADSPQTLAAELRALLQRRLPEYMQPAAFVPLDALPLTPSGKLDQRALPAPGAGAGGPAHDDTPPRSELEHLLVALWQETLGLERVGVNANFFDLGGHSLLIIQLHSRLRAALGRDVPVVTLFRYPTVSSLARALAEDTPAPAQESGQSRAELRKELMRQRRTSGRR
jgi:amino acid adenylation domain-containing protein